MPFLPAAASSVLRLQFLGSCQQCFGARTDGSAALSAVLSISHLNTSPQEGNRSPAKFRGERVGQDGEKERELRPHPCSSSKVENCDGSSVEAKRLSVKHYNRWRILKLKAVFREA